MGGECFLNEDVNEVENEGLVGNGAEGDEGGTVQDRRD